MELRSFLGFAGYNRKFVSGFSTIASPLNALLKGYTRTGPNNRLRTGTTAVRRPFGASWTSECEDVFLTLKSSLVRSPVLTIADHALPYELHTDASGTGLGAALYQRQEGRLRSVALASRGLSVSESHYPAHKLEFLALSWAVCHKFHDVLYGSTLLPTNNPVAILCY